MRTETDVLARANLTRRRARVTLARPCIWDNGIWTHYRVIVRVKMGRVYRNIIFSCTETVSRRRETGGESRPRSRKSDNEGEQRE